MSQESHKLPKVGAIPTPRKDFMNKFIKDVKEETKTVINCEICKTGRGTLIKLKKFQEKENARVHMECVEELVRQGFNIQVQGK